MSTVLLVRHGLTKMTGPVLAGRTPGLHLDERGTKQAAAVAARIAALPLTAIVTSPLDRCLETAEAILERPDPASRPGTSTTGIIECGYGDWTGKAIKDLAKDPLWKVVQAQPSAVRFPNGEALADMSARAVARDPRLGPAARRGRGLGRLHPRRHHQGHRRRRPRPAPGPVPAHRARPVLGVGDPLHRHPAVRHAGQRHRRRPGRRSRRRSEAPAQGRGDDATVGGGAGRRNGLRSRPRGAARAGHVLGLTHHAAALRLRPSPPVRRGHRRHARRPHLLPAGRRRRRAWSRSRWRSSRSWCSPTASSSCSTTSSSAPAPRCRPPRPTPRPSTSPIDEEFRVAAMGLAWDGDAGLIVIEAQAPVDEPEVAEETLLEDVEDGPDALRVLHRAAARAGVRRARPPARVGRPAAVPAVRSAARARRARLRAAQRLPPRHLAEPVSDTPDRADDREPDAARPRAGRRRAARRRGRRRGRAAARRRADASRAGSWTRPTPPSTAASSPGGRRAGLRLQAGRGRAAAVGLPGRHPGRAGGRGLRGLGRHRLGASSRRRSTATGPAGPGMVQLWIDVDDTVEHRPVHAAPRPRAAAAHRGVRRGDQQLRPQGRPPAADARRPRATASTTASPSASRTSCARCCGSGPGRSCPAEARTVLGRLAGRAGRRAGRAAR